MIEVEIGSYITVYGQIAKVIEIQKNNNSIIIWLEHSIIVPSVIYARDYITIDEIQK